MENKDDYNIIIYDVDDLELAIKKGKAEYKKRFDKSPCIVVLSHQDMLTNKLEPGDIFHDLKVKIYASFGTVHIGE